MTSFNGSAVACLQEGYHSAQITSQEIIDKTWICMNRYNEQRNHAQYFMPLRIIEAFKKEDSQERRYRLVVLIGEATAKKGEVNPVDFNFYTAWIREPDPERLLCRFDLVEEDNTGKVTIGNCRLVDDNETFP